MLNYIRRNEILTILCIEVVLTTMGMGLISPILPQYARSFGVSIIMVGLLLSAFGVSRLIFDIPAGRLADRYGRRLILIAGPLILAVGSVGCALAGSYWELLAFRFIQGIGSAIFTTAAMIMIADISVPANRAQFMSLFEGSYLLGIGLGPTMGGFIAQYFGPRIPFFVFALVAALASLWAYLRLKETKPALQWQEKRATNNATGPSKVGLGTGLKPVLKNFNFILISMVVFGIFFIRAGAQNQILPLLASDRLGSGEGQIGIALTIIAIIQFVTVLVGGRVSDRFARKAMITPGCLIAAASLAMLAESYNYSFLLFSCAAMGIGIGISAPTASAYVTDIIPKENYGSGMGLYRTISDLGVVTGPILLGWFADIWGYSFSLLFNCLYLFIAVIIFQVLAKARSALRTQ